MSFQSVIAANKIKIWVAVWVLAIVIAFLTRNNQSNIEPFFVGSGVTLIIWLGLRFMKTFDKIMDRAEAAAKNRK